ncbi:hypothetical protein Syun_001003 [Stephania yunnanensis]|uniref:CCHC-type domain-containing protein n=1 Tax=Stephania yunnanensis TaxID=152371 RepID=A0AAP0Q6P5_9MAGN
MSLSESFQVAAIIEKLPPSWRDFKNYLKQKRKEMGLEDLIVGLRIEEENKKNDNMNGDLSNEPKANLLEGQSSKSSKKRKYFSDEPKQFKAKANKFAGSCFICKKHGHKAKDCNNKWKKNKTQSKAHGDGYANFIEDELSKDVSDLNLSAAVFEANMVDNPRE